MDIAKYSITHKITTWLIVFFCVTGGLSAYQHISRFEDPEFTIKDALVITYYNGATPKEVEEEVTDKITTSIQQLEQVKETESISKPGYSKITVTIKDKYDKHSLPQVWDELRRKVNDVQKDLPPNASPSMVIDDFGDVYGILYAMTGDGYSYREIKKASDYVKKQLLLVDGVAKVNITGIQEEVIYVQISRKVIAHFGISLNEIYQLLQSQNEVLGAGNVRVKDEYIEIRPTGSISTVDDIGNLIIRTKKSNSLLHLSDIATIKRSYREVPREMIFHNGQPSLVIGISAISGSNVVEVGKRISKRLASVHKILPAGIEFSQIYNQPEVVDASVKGFIVNLLQAILIVLVVLVLFMGVESAVIISAILFLIVFGTLYLMSLFGISLERISLGALVIALGMLVDNAIVITEGILIKSQQGIDKTKAASQIVKQTQWPLLGATIVGILAFAPIGLSQDSTGEYCRSLFYVILISLLLSWVLAITVAPLFCHLLFKVNKEAGQNGAETQGRLVQLYQGFLLLCLNNRLVTLLTALLLMIAAVIGFSYIRSGFFPNSTTPMFYVDYWRAEGSDIRALKKDMLEISAELKKNRSVTSVSTFVGNGAQRFMLTYTPESENSSYGQILISVDDYKKIPRLSEELKAYIAKHYPASETQVRLIRLGPSGGAKIEARFSGSDPSLLRQFSEKAKKIMLETPGAIDVRDDWRHQVKIITPEFSENQARLTGITRSDVANAMQTAFSGLSIGYYRERDELIPIVSRAPDDERLNIRNMASLYIWSNLLQTSVPLGQLVTRFNTSWEDNIIARKNRLRTITVFSDPAPNLEASIVFNKMKGKIEAIKLPPGYLLEWGGEYESSMDAQAGLKKNIPMGVMAMIVIVILLFNAIKQPLIIWLCVPLSIIGVTIGLLVTNQPFDFMAILGFLSLTGMLIKNAIVLIDQIDLEIREGKEGFAAIVDSCLSRLRPVVLAALTTVLGMLPLLSDAFFKAMAVVIMFGLSFATLLTLIVVPVLYSVFFNIKPRKIDESH
jgi:multidrug efflux pump subunit AcrB